MRGAAQFLTVPKHFSGHFTSCNFLSIQGIVLDSVAYWLQLSCPWYTGVHTLSACRS